MSIAGKRPPDVEIVTYASFAWSRFDLGVKSNEERDAVNEYIPNVRFSKRADIGRRRGSYMNILVGAAECAGDDVGAQHQQRDEKYPPE